MNLPIKLDHLLSAPFNSDSDFLFNSYLGVHHQPRGYHSGSDNRLTSPGRFSPRHSDRERHGENTFDHVTKSSQNHRRSQEERIWQDPVSRGAESGQIRSPTDIQNIYLPSSNGDNHLKVRKPDPTNFRGYIEPGRPGSGLAAAAALARGDTYTPEKITTGGKVKVRVCDGIFLTKFI